MYTSSRPALPSKPRSDGPSHGSAAAVSSYMASVKSTSGSVCSRDGGSNASSSAQDDAGVAEGVAEDVREERPMVGVEAAAAAEVAAAAEAAEAEAAAEAAEAEAAAEAAEAAAAAVELAVAANLAAAPRHMRSMDGETPSDHENSGSL